MLKSNRYRSDQKKIISLNELAVKYRKQNNFKDAYEICKQLYDLDPAPDIMRQSVNLGIEHMRYHLIFGEILYLEHHFKQAMKVLNSLKPLGHALSEKYLILAKIHLINNDCIKALEEYDEMITTCKHRFTTILDGLLDVMKKDPFIERSYKLIFRLYKTRGVESEAIAGLGRKLKKENYQQQHLVCLFGLIFHYLGETSRAILLFTKYQTHSPKDVKPFFFKGNIFLETGRFQESIDQYIRVIELIPSRKTDVISTIEEISKREKVDSTVINFLVDLYIEEGKLKQAEQKLDYLLEMAPNDSQNRKKMEQVLVKTVENYFLNDQVIPCMSTLEKLIELRPENKKYQMEMKNIQGLITNRKIQEYEKRLKSDNLIAEEADNIHFSLAKLYVDSGIKEEKAISLLQKVAKSNSGKKAEALFWVGLKFLSKGYYDIADDNFNNLLTLSLPDKEILSYLYQIAIAYEKKDLHDKAKFFYAKIISIDMQYKDVSERLQKIPAIVKPTTGGAIMTNLNMKFENIEKMSDGDIWVSYKAVDKLLKRKVVIMITKEDFRFDPEAIDRLITETKYLSRSQHKGIVKIYDVNIDILLYIIMEHIDGESIRSIAKKKAFPIRDVLRIAIDTCNAIRCVHEEGIIHRDLRPDNIRLTKDNTVKISGFGLAHITNIPMSKKADQRAETLYYKSPEQIRGIEKEIDERSDIYSLGITFYEMLTGHVPFYKGDIAYKHLNEPPKSMILLNCDVPNWLDKIILKCLEKNPADRHQRVNHLQKVLETYSKFYYSD